MRAAWSLTQFLENLPSAFEILDRIRKNAKNAKLAYMLSLISPINSAASIKLNVQH
ncbi:hypothetical protein B597_012640 [Stutzerimonas stutzeri KOS6]|uniref:Uncharacterized protein n=1 Tax=Stutzerimonas stutzeri KOS6 TaxID=1218352 RepID=A0A061JR87_STUST|nr:hypothetical protein B597_012640 [Stutzerimonas stutzeri KOS6]